MANSPAATQRPHVLTAFGDDREDPWYWLRERDDPEVLAYLEAENAYTDRVLAPLDGLRTTLFEEMKARIHETDMSVPARRGPWWYYGAHRRGQGLRHPLPAARPGPPTSSLRPGSPGRRSRSCSTRTRWPRAQSTSPWAAPRSARTTAGWPTRPTPPATRRTSCASAPRRRTHRDRAPEIVADTGYGLAWSADVRLRLLRPPRRGHAPLPAVASPARHRPGGDVLVFEEADRRFSLGTGRTRDGAFVLIAAAQHQHHRVAGHPCRRPDAAPRVVLPRRGGLEYAVDHLAGDDRRLVRRR